MSWSELGVHFFKNGMLYKRGPQPQDWEFTPNELGRILDDRKRKRDEDKELFLWVTVKPKPGATMDQLNKYWSRVRAHKWCTGIEYCFDVRQPDFTGLHSHAIVRLKKDMSKGTRNSIRRDLRRPPKCLPIANLDKNIWIMKKELKEHEYYRDYLRGNKEEHREEKRIAIEATVAFRTQHNIEDIIGI